MVSAIRRGVMDLIGAARPSIADPFLPRKIEEGREDEIRECIGCNICVAADNQCVPIRCTQNPTMGEGGAAAGTRSASRRRRRKPAACSSSAAGRRGWNSRALGCRGVEVTLAEAGTRLGGRLLHEATLPGLASWMRVADHRIHALKRMANVTIALDSRPRPTTSSPFGARHVYVATGAALAPRRPRPPAPARRSSTPGCSRSSRPTTCSPVRRWLAGRDLRR